MSPDNMIPAPKGAPIHFGPFVVTSQVSPPLLSSPLPILDLEKRRTLQEKERNKNNSQQ